MQAAPANGAQDQQPAANGAAGQNQNGQAQAQNGAAGQQQAANGGAPQVGQITKGMKDRAESAKAYIESKYQKLKKDESNRK